MGEDSADAASDDEPPPTPPALHDDARSLALFESPPSPQPLAALTAAATISLDEITAAGLRVGEIVHWTDLMHAVSGYTVEARSRTISIEIDQYRQGTSIEIDDT